MQFLNTSQRYGIAPVILHWGVVAGVIVQYLLAQAAEHYQRIGGDATGAMNIHQSLGITLLVLALLRAMWRVFDPPPSLPMQMPRLERALARGVHLAFYLVLFAVPLTGWALATADGQPLRIFGQLELPQLRIGGQLPVPGGTLSKQQLALAHEILVNVLLGLAVVHVSAALIHQLIDGMGSRRGMLPTWHRRRGDKRTP